MKLRHILTILAAVAVCAPAAMAQRKLMTPPHVMVVPDMIYCKNHGYIQTFDNMGVAEEVPDYERALKEDPSLHSALTQIAQLMTDRSPNIVIVDLLEAINLAKEDAAMNTANGGDESESIEEAIIRNSNSDILVKVQFDLLKTGPNYRVAYTLRGTDAYTAQMFAPFEGVGPDATSANPVLLLREAIYGGMDGFLNKILTYYQKMTTTGRMVAFDIKITNTSALRMGSRIGDLTLRELIDDFLYDNSVDGGGLERMKGGETFMQYSGVYIPLTYTLRGRQRRQGAKDVAQKLVNHLAENGIQADFKVKGLGKVNIYIR